MAAIGHHALFSSPHPRGNFIFMSPNNSPHSPEAGLDPAAAAPDIDGAIDSGHEPPTEPITPAAPKHPEAPAPKPDIRENNSQPKTPEEKKERDETSEKDRKEPKAPEAKEERVSHESLIAKRHGVASEHITKVDLNVSGFGKLRFENGKLYDSDGRIMEEKFRELKVSAEELNNLRWLEKNLGKDGIDCGQIFEKDGRKMLAVNELNEHGELEPSFYDLGAVEKKIEIDSDSGGHSETHTAPVSEPVILDVGAFWRELEEKEQSGFAALFDLTRNEEAPIAQVEDAEPATDMEEGAAPAEVPDEAEEALPANGNQNTPEEKRVIPTETAATVKSAEFTPAMTFENDQIVFTADETKTNSLEREVSSEDISGTETATFGSDTIGSVDFQKQAEAASSKTETFAVRDASFEAPEKTIEPGEAVRTNLKGVEQIRINAAAPAPERVDFKPVHAEIEQKTADTEAADQKVTENAPETSRTATAEKNIADTRALRSKDMEKRPVAAENIQKPHAAKAPEIDKTESSKANSQEVRFVEVPAQPNERPAVVREKEEPVGEQAPLSRAEALLLSLGSTKEMISRYREAQRQTSSGTIPTEAVKNQKGRILEEDPDSGIRLIATM
jgi:hypothetical protein